MQFITREKQMPNLKQALINLLENFEIQEDLTAAQTRQDIAQTIKKVLKDPNCKVTKDSQSWDEFTQALNQYPALHTENNKRLFHKFLEDHGLFKENDLNLHLPNPPQSRNR